MPQFIAQVAVLLLEIGIQTLITVAFAPHPQRQAGTQDPLKQPTPPRRSGFGEARISGFQMLFEAVPTSDTAATAVQVIALHDGRIDAFTHYYFHDDEITLTGSSGVHGPDGRKYEYGNGGDRCFFYTRLGLDTETAYAEVIALCPDIWTADHRGDGIASCAVICKQSKDKYQREDFPNGLPAPSVAARLQRVFDPRDEGQTQGDKSTYAWSANPVLCLLAYLTDANGGMGLDYDRYIAPEVAAWITAADVCDEDVDVTNVHAAVSVEATPGDDHLVLVSVDGLAPGSTVSAGAETLTVDHIVSLTVYFTADLTLDHAAGELVYWTSTGSTEKRYRCGGVYEHPTNPNKVIGGLLDSFDGFMAPTGTGALTVLAGRYYTPTVTLGDDDITDYDIDHFLTDEEAVNQLVVSFTDPATKFQTGDAGIWEDAADITARGVQRSQPFDLPWVPSSSQARRLAKRRMTRLTAERRGTIKTNLGGFKALGERYLRLQISERADLANLVVEVGKVEIDIANLSLTVSFTEADPDIDAWTIAEELTPAPVGGRVPVTPLEAPTITLAEAFYETSGYSTTTPRLRLTIDAPITADVEWRYHWRVSGSTTWVEASATDIDDGAGVTLETGFVTADATIEVEAAYDTAGSTSPWSATATVVTYAVSPYALLDELGAPLLDETGDQLLDEDAP